MKGEFGHCRCDPAKLARDKRGSIADSPVPVREPGEADYLAAVVVSRRSDLRRRGSAAWFHCRFAEP